MSDRIYALLVRLYPAGLRRDYRGDALRLIRDRWRDERGLVLRLRLCLDLTADLLATRLRSRRSARSLVSACDSAGGGPSFQLLELARPRLDALLAGMVLSVLLVAAFTRMMPPLGHYDLTTVLRTLAGLRPGLFQSGPPQAPALPSVDASVRRKVIDIVAAHLRQHYVSPAIGRQLADAVVAHHSRGDYDSLATGAALAGRLTEHIRESSRTLGVPAGEFVADVIYSQRPLPPQPPPPGTPVERPPEALEQYRSAMLQQNCLLGAVETRPGNIGYVKLNGFPDASVCQAMTRAAMASINDVDALILDLRDNNGGYGNTAMQIAAYLFDHPEYLFDPREPTSARAWTPSPVPESRLAETPVYVLTSSRTFSAAEYFTYNLKMLKRATIVGETTRGGQHSGLFLRIDDHFGIGVQHVAPINPFPVKGWELIGVEPDVKVPSGEALEAATKLSESRRRRR